MARCEHDGSDLAVRASSDGETPVAAGVEDERPEASDELITFLLTDGEGSTALWEQAGRAMRVALERHDRLFEDTVATHTGIHVRPRGEGDSRFAVFRAVSGAVSSALAIQHLFSAESWPTRRPIRVRVGVHTGRAVSRDDDYYGTDVNRCARLRDLAR